MSDNRFYTGITKNLNLRLKQHNEGRSKFTSRFLPVKIIHYESFNSYHDARLREVLIKTVGAKKYLAKKNLTAIEKKISPS